MKNQYCFDKTHNHTVGADIKSSFWCRTCHPYGNMGNGGGAISVVLQTPDEKVLDYLERAEEIVSNFIDNKPHYDDIEGYWVVIEIAKLLQREEKL